MKLVLSGFHITAMKQLEDADQSLYGRRTARIALAPFDYVRAAGFAPGYTAPDRLRAYGMFGGLPAEVEAGTVLQFSIDDMFPGGAAASGS